MRRAALAVALVAVVSGCGGHRAQRITIAETTGVGRTLQRHTYWLECDPARGTLPLAGEVCAAIRAHHRAMLDPPATRTTCGGTVGGPSLVVRTGSRQVSGSPACGWPGGSGLLLYEAAIDRDLPLLRLAASRLRCDEAPRLLARPTPWREVDACLAVGTVESHVPPWLVAAERRALVIDVGGARPVYVARIFYPRKVAVVFVFRHPVVCRICSSPFGAGPIRAGGLRVSFDRQTHRQGNELHLCRARGDRPPLAACLAR